jgi:hypothetical protein
MSRRYPAAVLIMLVLSAGAAQAYSSGVPTGLTGAPSEGTCANCHGNLNTGSGGISISAPYSYAPGETLEIVVDLHHMGQSRWGFELTCLDGAGEPAGHLILTDPTRTQFDSDSMSGREYMMHTSGGNDEGHMNLCLGWTFEWVAPSDSSPQVTFYAAGVAGNDASGPGGDYVYTTTRAIDQTPVDAKTWGSIKELYR